MASPAKWRRSRSRCRWRPCSPTPTPAPRPARCRAATAWSRASSTDGGVRARARAGSVATTAQMDQNALELARGVSRAFRGHMLEEYVPRIEGCVRALTEPEVWHRPNRHCNAIGNLLLHLEGN